MSKESQNNASNTINKKSYCLKKIIVATALIVFLGSGIKIGLWWRGLHPLPVALGPSFQQIRESAFSPAKYKFINPLLTCETSSRRGLIEFKELKNRISAIIDNKINSQKIKTASIYFDNREGHWLGINIEERYFPASLMKVPLMIAIFKEAEYNPEFLNQKILHTGQIDQNNSEYFKSGKRLESHQSYTVAELTERMIVDSDNNATLLLVNAIRGDLNEILTDLGLEIPADGNPSLGDYITVKQYVNVFRILYNASYLNREYSEKALNLLSRSNFYQGIRAGVPAGSVVAEKFGERNFSTDPNDKKSLKELHDCGIVYGASHHYALCIMTKGNDFAELVETIKEISVVTNQYVTAENK